MGNRVTVHIGVAGHRKAHQDLVKVGGGIRELGNTISAFQGMITGLSIGILVNTAREQFKTFETATTDMAKVTERDLGLVKQEIMQLPSILGDSTSLMQGYYQTISAGITGVAESQDFLVTAARASNAAHVQQGEVVKALSKTMAGYGDEIKSATEAADLLFSIEKVGQTSVAELVPVIGDLAAVSHEAKVNQYEMAGSLALITQTSGSTAEAATKYKAIVMELLKPSKDLGEAIAQTGAASGDALIQQRGFIGALEALEGVAASSGQSLSKMFGSQEASLGVTALQAEGFDKLRGSIEGVKDGAGSMDAAFEKWKGTSEAIEQAFTTAIGKISIGIGERLAPAINSSMQLVTKLLTENEQAVYAFGDALVTVAQIAAVGGALYAVPILFTTISGAVGVAGTALAGMGTVMAGIIAHIQAGTGTFAALNTSLYGTKASALAASGALGALKVAGGILFAAFAGWKIGSWLSDNFEEARIAGVMMVDSLMKGWLGFEHGTKIIWQSIKLSYYEMIDGLRGALGDFLAKTADSLQKLPGIGEGMASGLRFSAESLQAPSQAVQDHTQKLVEMEAQYQKSLNTHNDVIDSLLRTATGYKGADPLVNEHTESIGKNTTAVTANAKAVSESAQKITNEYVAARQLAAAEAKMGAEADKTRLAAQAAMYKDHGILSKEYYEVLKKEIADERDKYLKATKDKVGAEKYYQQEVDKLNKKYDPDLEKRLKKEEQDRKALAAANIRTWKAEEKALQAKAKADIEAMNAETERIKSIEEAWMTRNKGADYRDWQTELIDKQYSKNADVLGIDAATEIRVQELKDLYKDIADHARDTNLKMAAELNSSGGFFDAFKVGMEAIKAETYTWGEMGLQAAAAFSDGSRDLIKTGIFGLIEGDMDSFSDAWDSMWKSMLGNVVDFASNAIFGEISGLLSGVFGGSGPQAGVSQAGSTGGGGGFLNSLVGAGQGLITKGISSLGNWIMGSDDIIADSGAFISDAFTNVGDAWSDWGSDFSFDGLDFDLGGSFSDFSVDIPSFSFDDSSYDFGGDAWTFNRDGDWDKKKNGRSWLDDGRGYGADGIPIIAHPGEMIVPAKNAEQIRGIMDVHGIHGFIDLDDVGYFRDGTTNLGGSGRKKVPSMGEQVVNVVEGAATGYAKKVVVTEMLEAADLQDLGGYAGSIIKAIEGDYAGAAQSAATHYVGAAMDLPMLGPMVSAVMAAIQGDMTKGMSIAGGAAVGSAIPGIGTAIGALIGGILGGFSGGGGGHPKVYLNTGENLKTQADAEAVINQNLPELMKDNRAGYEAYASINDVVSSKYNIGLKDKGIKGDEWLSELIGMFDATLGIYEQSFGVDINQLLNDNPLNERIVIGEGTDIVGEISGAIMESTISGIASSVFSDYDSGGFLSSMNRDQLTAAAAGEEFLVGRDRADIDADMAQIRGTEQWKEQLAKDMDLIKDASGNWVTTASEVSEVYQDLVAEAEAQTHNLMVNGGEDPSVTIERLLSEVNTVVSEADKTFMNASEEMQRSLMDSGVSDAVLNRRERDYRGPGGTSSVMGVAVTEMRTATAEEKLLAQFGSMDLYEKLQKEEEQIMETTFRVLSMMKEIPDSFGRIIEMQEQGLTSIEAIGNFEKIQAAMAEVDLLIASMSQNQKIDALRKLKKTHDEYITTIYDMYAVEDEINKIRQGQLTEMGQAVSGLDQANTAEMFWGAITDAKGAIGFLKDLENQMRSSVSKTVVDALSESMSQTFIAPLNEAIGGIVSQLLSSTIMAGGVFDSANLNAANDALDGAIAQVEGIANLMSDPQVVARFSELFGLAERFVNTIAPHEVKGYDSGATSNRIDDLINKLSQFMEPFETLIRQEGLSDVAKQIDNLNTKYFKAGTDLDELLAKQLDLNEAEKQAYRDRLKEAKDVELRAIGDSILKPLRDAVERDELGDEAYEKLLIERKYAQIEADLKLLGIYDEELVLNAKRIEMNGLLNSSIEDLASSILKIEEAQAKMLGPEALQELKLDRLDVKYETAGYDLMSREGREAVLEIFKNEDARLLASWAASIGVSVDDFLADMQYLENSLKDTTISKSLTDAINYALDTARGIIDGADRDRAEMARRYGVSIDTLMSTAPDVINEFLGLNESALRQKAAAMGLNDADGAEYIKQAATDIGVLFKMVNDNVTETRTALKNSYQGEIVRLQEELDALNKTLDTARDDYLFFLNEEISTQNELADTARDAADELKSLSESMGDYLKSLSTDNATVAPDERYAAAFQEWQSVVRDTKSSDLDVAMEAMGRLPDVSAQWLEASQAANANVAVYNSDLAAVKAVLTTTMAVAELQAGKQDDIADAADIEIERLEDIVSGITDTVRAVADLAAAESAYNAAKLTLEKSNHEQLIGEYQAEITALNSLTDAIVPLNQALAAYTKALNLQKQIEIPAIDEPAYAPPAGDKIPRPHPVYTEPKEPVVKDLGQRPSPTAPVYDDLMGAISDAGYSAADFAGWATANQGNPQYISDAIKDLGNFSAADIAGVLSDGMNYTILTSQVKDMLPGFATGGFHSGGLRIVGEEGPELEFTGPSRIMSNRQTMDLLGKNNNKEVVEALREVKDEIKKLLDSNKKVATLLGRRDIKEPPGKSLDVLKEIAEKVA